MKRKPKLLSFSAIFALCVGISALTSAEAQSLTWLGVADGGDSLAYGVSDNAVVVGVVSTITIGNTELRAFRWTARTGIQELGTFGGNLSEAIGVSADGSVVVGWATNADGQARAFRWQNGTLADLGALGGDGSKAYGVSADGSVVVGWAADAEGRIRAFRWQSGAMQDIGDLGGGASEARSISADGAVVVGKSENADGYARAFRWTAEGGMQDLGTLGGDWSEAVGVSADGAVVIGNAPNARGGFSAFRWTVEDGMQDLGTLPGGEDFSVAWGVSADGSMIVGYAYDANFTARAFRWTAQAGMQDLNQLYAALLRDGSTLERAFGISPNGRYIVGQGYNAATDRYEAFLLDTVPEPASLLALGVGLMGLARRRRR